MTARIRRVRAAPESTTVQRVRRVRPAKPQGLPRYIVDWSVPLGGKLQLYLMASFLYYECNRSVLTDSDYDQLCVELYKGWRTFEHPHKHLTSRDLLQATTGYSIKYPTIVKMAAWKMLELHSEV